MKKVILGILLFSVGLVGCDSKSANSSNKTSEKESQEIVKISELEKYGLTHKESVGFDKFCTGVNDSIEKINDLDLKITNGDETSTSDVADILLAGNKIESAYSDLGGNNQDMILRVLQSGPFSPVRISKDMIEYDRNYTATEAYGFLHSIITVANDLAKEKGFDNDKQLVVKKYVLDKINCTGNFIPARNEILKI